MSGEASYSGRWSVESGASPSFTSSSVRWGFLSDNVALKGTLLQSQSIRGTRATITRQTRYASNNVGGSLSINPSPKFLGWALPLAMGGGTETAPAFADAIPEWALLADRGTGGGATGDCYKYLGLKINRLSLSIRAGNLVECTIDVVGKTETAGQTFAGAALGTTLAYEPYQAADVSFTGGAGVSSGAALPLLDGTLTIDNGLSPRWAVGSNNANQILEGRRLVTFSGNLAIYDSDMLGDLYDGASTAGIAATLTISNSTVSTAFSFNALQLIKQSPQIAGQEFVLPVAAEIRGTTGVEFTVTNDVTP